MPVYFNPPVSAQPEILPDELYIFPVASIRILVENDVTGSVQWVRLPDMRVGDLAVRLLEVGGGSFQELWLRWARERGGRVRWKRLDLGAESVLREVERGACGERIGGGMERAIRICGV
jgi:hypothetical protein